MTGASIETTLEGAIEANGPPGLGAVRLWYEPSIEARI